MNMKTAITIFVISLLFVAAAVKSQDAEIGISAEVPEASIDFEAKDTLIVKLSWKGEPFLYQIDDFPMPQLDKLQILGSSSSVSSKTDSLNPADEYTTRTLTYVLEPLDYGTGVIQSLTITATNKITKESHQLQTGRLTVEIAKPAPKVDKASISDLTIIILAVIGVGVVVVIVIVVMRRKKPIEASTDTLQYYLGALEAVKKESVADRKLFFSRLYRLLIQYLEKEQGLALSGKTGEEVIAQVHQIENAEIKATIISWLERLQKEKYRPDTPAAGEVEDMYKTVCAFFEKHIL